MDALYDFAMHSDLQKIFRVSHEFRLGSDYYYSCAPEIAYCSKQGQPLHPRSPPLLHHPSPTQAHRLLLYCDAIRLGPLHLLSLH
ncbi:hypothetical protein NL676_039812 [Syzygium grande]|nr:hypothetical protein NL676_039812 [Syzygium grande]